MQLNYYLNGRDIYFGRVMLMFYHKVLLTFSILTICFLTFELSSSPEVRRYGISFEIFFIAVAFGLSVVVYYGCMLVVTLFMVGFGKHVGLLGAHKLEIKDEGLEESTTVNKSLHRWNPEFRVKEFGNYVWIFTTADRFFQIPKRNGGHEGDLAGFVAQLRSKMSKGSLAA